MNVVDVGCFDYDGANSSMRELVREYRPERLYGFDANPRMGSGTAVIDGCRAEFICKAAWVFDGTVSFHDKGSGSEIASLHRHDQKVPCFDFSAWLGELGESVVVKMDVEGAEYGLMKRMIVDETASLVSELLIEWHGRTNRSRPLLRRWPGPVREWWM